MELTTLFDYYHEANKDFIQKIIQTQGLPERVRVLMSHILNAQAIWLDRCNRESPRFGVWQMHEDHQLMPIHNSLETYTQEILSKGNFERNIFYQNSKGIKFSNSLNDILFHVINHGTHHRGQMAYLLSQVGIKPPTNDYIFRRRKPEVD